MKGQAMNPSVHIKEEPTGLVRPLLEIKDLAINFATSNGEVNAVRNAHFTVMPGETVAIVGESGS
jgi:peptide/nickel transport system ATP-binding protein